MIQYKKCKQCKQLIFDVPKLERLDQVHILSVEVKVDTGATDETDVTSIGLDRYVQVHNQSTNNCTTEGNSSCNHNNNNINNTSSCEAITVQFQTQSILEIIFKSYRSKNIVV